MTHEPHKPPMLRRRFSGPVTHTQVTGREYAVDHEYYYRDRNGFLWWERMGTLSDGGSIPKFFWRVVGSPFVGPVGAYRIHDLICRLAKEGGVYNGLSGRALREHGDKVVLPDAIEDYNKVVPGSLPSKKKRMLTEIGVRIGGWWANLKGDFDPKEPPEPSA